MRRRRVNLVVMMLTALLVAAPPAFAQGGGASTTGAVAEQQVGCMTGAGDVAVARATRAQRPAPTPNAARRGGPPPATAL